MRSLINLVESAQAYVTREGFEAWLIEQKRNPTFAEGDFAYTLELIEEWGWDNYLAQINHQFAEMADPMVLYRGLHIPYRSPDEVTAMIRSPLGLSWTWEFGVAINENGPEGGYARHGEGETTNVVVEALIKKMDIDWYYTAFLQVAEFDEPEIRLKKGAIARVVKVHLLDDHSWDKHDKHVIYSGTGQFAPESRERIVQSIDYQKIFST